MVPCGYYNIEFCVLDAMAPPSVPSREPGGAKKRGKYTTLTLEKKAAIIKLIQSGRSQLDVAKEYHLSKQTVSDYVKNSAKILSAFENSHNKSQKNDSKGVHPALEEALQLWLKGVLAKNLPVSGDLLKEKAESFALKMGIEEFKFTDGWLRGFKKRHGISFKKVSGESGAVDQTIVSDYRVTKLQALLKEYAPSDIFNCDETGLFFKMLPDRTLAFSGESCASGKLSKERITVMVGANATGTEKLPLLVIGKARNPRCFKAVRTLPVEYDSNSKAWITQSLFERYIRKLDRKFARQNRKVIFFVDNCGAHGSVPNLEAIRLEFLPPNTTSVLQPMDQGMIRNIKAHYRARLLSRTVLCLDSGKVYKVDLLAAIHMLADAWKAVKPETIAHCFRHAGFAAAEEPEADDLDVGDPDGTDGGDDLMNDLRSGGVDVPATMTFKDFARTDDNVVSCAEPTDDEILRQVVQQPESGSDDDDDDRPQPSAAEIANAVTLLSSVYGDDVTLAQIQTNLIASKRTMRQGSIKDFFKPA